MMNWSRYWVMQKDNPLLGLEYRVAKLSTGDMSFAAAKCATILRFGAPGVDKYLEVFILQQFLKIFGQDASIFVFGMNGKLRFVHTFNGSGLLAQNGCALLKPRKDGSVLIPDVLQLYGRIKVIAKL